MSLTSFACSSPLYRWIVESLLPLSLSSHIISLYTISYFNTVSIKCALLAIWWRIATTTATTNKQINNTNIISFVPIANNTWETCSHLSKFFFFNMFSLFHTHSSLPPCISIWAQQQQSQNYENNISMRSFDLQFSLKYDCWTIAFPLWAEQIFKNI